MVGIGPHEIELRYRSWPLLQNVEQRRIYFSLFVQPRCPAEKFGFEYTPSAGCHKHEGWKRGGGVEKMGVRFSSFESKAARINILMKRLKTRCSKKYKNSVVIRSKTTWWSNLSWYKILSILFSCCWLSTFYIAERFNQRPESDTSPHEFSPLLWDCDGSPSPHSAEKAEEKAKKKKKSGARVSIARVNVAPSQRYRIKNIVLCCQVWTARFF